MLKKTIILTILLLFICTIHGNKEEWSNFPVYKQYLDRSEELFNAESYNELRAVCRQALQLIGHADWANLSVFHFYIGQSFMNQNTDSAIFYLKNASLYAERSQSINYIVKANTYLLFMYDRCTMDCKAERDVLYLKLKKISYQNISLGNRILLLDGLADYYDVTGQETLYLSSLLKEMSLAEQYIKLGKGNSLDSNNLGVVYQNLGSYYHDSNQPVKSIEYYKLSRIWIQHYRKGVASFYMGMINAYLLNDNLEHADIYIDSLNRFSENVGDGVADIAMRSCLALAEYHASRNHLDAAWRYYDKAKSFAAKNSNEVTNGRMKWMAALLLTKAKKYKEAYPYLKEIKMQADGWPLNLYVSYLKTLAECYSGLNRYASANVYYELYITYADSLNNKSHKQSLAHAEAEYQNERKQLEINNQSNTIRLAQRQRLWLIIALSSMIIVALLMYLIYRNKKRSAFILNNRNIELQQLNHQLNEANKTKATLFSILSHDLRAPISDVYQFLKIQYMDSNTLSYEEKKILEEELRMGAASLLETMEDLLIWSKTQLEFIQTEILEVDVGKLFRQCQELLQLNIQSKGLKIVNKIPHKSIIKTDANFLQTIIRNLLQNAIKASPENGVIEVGFLKDTQSYKPQFWLKNGGVPFSQENYLKALSESNFSRNLHQGLGLKLIEELSRRIEVEVRFDITDKTQTCCTLIFH